MAMMAGEQAQELMGHTQARLHPRDLAALLGANVALALGPWFVRMSETGPVASAFWRMALALPLLFILARRFEGGTKIVGGQRWWLLLAGMFFAADLASWHLGILQTKLANATLLGNMASLLYPIYGFIALARWPVRTQIAALILALIGGALLMGRSYELSQTNLIGDLLCLAAGVFYTFYLVGIEKARGSLPQWSVLAWSTLASAGPLLIFASILNECIIPSDWTPVLLLALGSQIIGQGLLVYALGRVPPLVIGLAFLTQPFIAALLGWVIYREALGPLDWVGAALIALALVLVRRVDPA
jgi:drug/metabolite transporter (DMT)-like permease